MANSVERNQAVRDQSLPMGTQRRSRTLDYYDNQKEVGKPLTLETLPTDVLIDIFRFIVDDNSRLKSFNENLIDLMLISKTLQKPMEEALHLTVRVRSNVQADNLLNTLISSPQKFNHCKTLIWELNQSINDDHRIDYYMSMILKNFTNLNHLSLVLTFPSLNQKKSFLYILQTMNHLESLEVQFVKFSHSNDTIMITLTELFSNLPRNLLKYLKFKGDEGTTSLELVNFEQTVIWPLLDALAFTKFFPYTLTCYLLDKYPIRNTLKYLEIELSYRGLSALLRILNHSHFKIKGLSVKLYDVYNEEDDGDPTPPHERIYNFPNSVIALNLAYNNLNLLNLFNLPSKLTYLSLNSQIEPIHKSSEKLWCLALSISKLNGMNSLYINSHETIQEEIYLEPSSLALQGLRMICEEKQINLKWLHNDHQFHIFDWEELRGFI